MNVFRDSVDRIRRFSLAHLPSVGGISLVTLSSTVMEKQFLRNVLGDTQVLVKDALWWYSHLGIGTWIYQRKHLQSTDAYTRFSFSVLGSLIFNEGVMLLLAMLRLRLPNCKHVTIPLGFGACFGLVHYGRVYGRHCDSLIPVSSSSSASSSASSDATTSPKASSQNSKSSSPLKSAQTKSLSPDVSDVGSSLSLG